MPRHIWPLMLALACSTSAQKSARLSDTADSDDTGSEAEACSPGVALEPGAVRTASAVIQGALHGAGTRVLGIPFAEAPIASRRFAPPESYACRDGEVLDGTTWPEPCAQPVPDSDSVRGDEDCLVLNVFTPDTLPLEDEDTADRPVLVFVHGGGHVQGSTVETIGARSDAILYDGAELASRMGVVVVTLQYRLGALGYLAHPALTADDGGSGNWGLRDQQLALSWVGENIAQFGGDADSVMLFGESAGGVATCMHLASPTASGLFQSALIQSGGCGATPASEAVETAVAAAEALGCAEATDVATCLRAEAPLEALVGLSGDIVSDIGVPTGGGWGPSVDGHVLTQAPLDAIRLGAHNDVPVVIGSNADETAAWVPDLTEAEYAALLRGTFGDGADAVGRWYPLEDYDSPRWAWIAVTSDVTFTCPSVDIATLLAASQTAPVWTYHYDHAVASAAGNYLGAYHGLELLFVFQSVERAAAESGYSRTAADSAVEAAMGRAWSNFAETGDPSSGSHDLGGSWPPVGSGSSETWLIADPVGAEAHPRARQCAQWSPFLGVL